MKLIILTQYYPPEIGAPQARLSEMAERFVKAGHEVTVMTAMPNYPTGVIQDGYGGWTQSGELYGARVIRSFIYPTQKTDFLRRLSNYFSFVLSSAIVGSRHLPRADYLLVQSPPLFLGISGYWLSRLKRCRLIFNVSDLWPESAVHIGVIKRESLFFRISKRIEAFCYRKSWLVTGQSHSIVKDIQHRFPNAHTFHVSNGVDTKIFEPEKYDPERQRALRRNLPNGIAVIYVGLHGLAQGLDQIVKAAKILQTDANIQITLVGDGAEKTQLVDLSLKEGCSNIEFQEPVPKSEVPSILASSDIVLVPLKTEIPGSIPSKLYEAMASAKPVVIIAKGEAAEIVQRYACGIVIEPNNVQSLANAIQGLASNPEMRRQMGNNGRAAAIEHFDRDKITQRFIDYLEGHL